MKITAEHTSQSLTILSQTKCTFTANSPFFHVHDSHPRTRGRYDGLLGLYKRKTLSPTRAGTLWIMDTLDASEGLFLGPPGV